MTEQQTSFKHSYFVNPEGSTALQNLLNKAKADFLNNKTGAAIYENNVVPLNALSRQARVHSFSTEHYSVQAVESHHSLKV